MHTLNLARIIRVKGSHQKELVRCFDLQDALQSLAQQNFTCSEQASDGFIVTFEHAEQKHPGLNTLLYFCPKGYFIDAVYTC